MYVLTVFFTSGTKVRQEGAVPGVLEVYTHNLSNVQAWRIVNADSGIVYNYYLQGESPLTPAYRHN